MLDFDRLRGDHSTGVCAIFKPYNGDWAVRTAKEAVPGDIFVRSKVWEDVSSMTSKAGVGSVYRQMPKAIFGHNRYATRGEVNARNAHPFHHGKIILAHNGTLTNQGLLPDSKMFEVDSENIAYSIDKIGFEETLKKLCGAFTLIWLNTEEKTINIIRNEQRPFHLIETVGGDWYGASEGDMVKWLVSRNKGPKTFKRSFEIEVGVQYIFDVSNGCELKEEKKHTLPTFRSYSSYPVRTAGLSPTATALEQEAEAWYEERQKHHAAGNGVGNAKTQGTAVAGTLVEKRQEANDILNTAGIEATLGGVIEFQGFSWKPYPLKPENGLMQGWLPEHDEYIEVQVHCVPESTYNTNAYYKGVVKSVYVHNYVVTIIAQLVADTDTKDVEEEATDLSVFLDSVADDNDVPELVLTTKSGEGFNAKSWKHSKHNVCAMCDNPIMFDEVPNAIIENSYCFCGDCDDAAKVRREKEEAGSNAMSPVWCTDCNIEHDASVIRGTASLAAYQALPGSCQWKGMHLEAAKKRVEDIKKANTPRPILSLVKKKPVVEKEELCSACGVEIPVSLMSDKEDLCNACYSRFHQATEVKLVPKFPIVVVQKTKTLMNKMVVSKENWEKMNTCRRCSVKINWADADSCDFWGQAPICFDCSYELTYPSTKK